MDIPRRQQSLFALIVVLVAWPVAFARGEGPGWNPQAAASYLDERARAWFAFDGRGTGATRSTCISCHTLLPYALARPVLRGLSGTSPPAEPEAKLLAEIGMRVGHWTDLDSKAFGLYYDGSDQKKRESRGTEAVFNAVVLAFDGRHQGRTSPSEATKRAFANLWATQVRTGEQKGTWDWLDFGEPPWGIVPARYFGAALAAIAVGTAPGYYTAGTDRDADAGLELLRDYLRSELDRQDLHNQAWGLWAAANVSGILTTDQRGEVIERLLARQRDDGGWSLPSLGAWARSDGTPQSTASDGYATGLLLHVAQTAGVDKSHARVARGLAWLKTHQSPSGAWPCASVFKKRDPSSHTGKFMSDAATAFAVLALGH
ncbi:MAG TPA: hypothetical protein VNH11_27355 [Pirellulales bacterium]|nr:hypothetical protein [Pirellulales bacterium]